ncbi:MAG TPA: hypothetical protein VMS32_03780 [Verrucomicrobiae bacterium]|jgi:hypothetical protein|nr:hypothetical protein [Verrucomicrobiae bacterium]
MFNFLNPLKPEFLTTLVVFGDDVDDATEEPPLGEDRIDEGDDSVPGDPEDPGDDY